MAQYAVAGRACTAEFSHDLPGRYVVAENDEARILTGELREPESRAPAPGSRAAQSRRLSSVPSQDELPLGDDAIELVREREAASAEKVAEIEPGADTADADWIADDPAVADEPVTAAAPVTHDEPDLAPDEEPPGEDAEPDSAPAAEETAGETPGETPAEPATEPAPEPAPPKRKSRSSVPSWDEIMFGGGNNE